MTTKTSALMTPNEMRTACIKMWTWIANQPDGTTKIDWEQNHPEESQLLDNYYSCYTCLYDFHFGENDCTHCPLGYIDDNYHCTNSGEPFQIWDDNHTAANAKAFLEFIKTNWKKGGRKQMKPATYNQIRNTLKTGDVIAFGGQGYISAAIKFVTNCNVSHVGIVLQTSTSHKNFNVVQLMESTTLEGDGKPAGVNIRRLSTKLTNYHGNVWALPLANNVRKQFNDSAFLSFMFSQQGKPYDAPQAIGSALDRIFSDNAQDLSKLFCSELVCAGLTSAGIPNLPANASEQTPRDIISLPIYQDCIQILGKPTQMID